MAAGQFGKPTRAKRPRISSGRVTISAPLPKLPSMPRVPKSTPGWGTTEITVRARGAPFVGSMVKPLPAGEPPASFGGTQPEWSIYWACLRNGMQEGVDFQYNAVLPGVWLSNESQIDFVFSDYHIGIEVQGELWHYGMGSQKMFKDMQRASLFQELGLQVIFVDENNANDDPEFYLEEALQGRDHSKLTSR